MDVTSACKVVLCYERKSVSKLLKVTASLQVFLYRHPYSVHLKKNKIKI